MTSTMLMRRGGTYRALISVTLALAVSAGGHLAQAQFQRLSDLADAALSGDIAKVRQLLGRGAEVNGDPKDYLPPLCAAIAPFIGETDPRQGPPAIALTQEQRLKNKLLIARLLMERGADVNRPGEWHMTALHQAVSFAGDERASIPIVKELLRRGARIDAAAEGGVTPLQLAIDHRRVSVARVLVKAGADPTLGGPGGRSAIKAAEDRGFVDLVGEMEAASKRARRARAKPLNVPSPTPEGDREKGR